MCIRDSFNAVYIALDDAGLHAMELRDNFGQATQIKFTNFKKNVAIPPETLQFEPPAGVDVLGEAVDAIQPENVVPAPADEAVSTVTPEPLVNEAQATELQEASDEAPGIAETFPLEEQTEREIIFEETFVPAE